MATEDLLPNVDEPKEREDDCPTRAATATAEPPAPGGARTIEAGAAAVEALLAQQDAIHRGKESLIWRLSNGELLDAAEHGLLAFGGWSAHKIQGETSRVREVAKLQARAGTAAELAADQERAKAAADVLNRKRPALEAKIQELTAQLRELESTHQQASDAVVEKVQARRLLRHRAPGFVVAAHHRTRANIEQTYKRVGELEMRLVAIDSVSALEIGNEKHMASIVGHCSSLPAGHPAKAYEVKSRDNMWEGRVRRDAWQQYLLDLKAERPGVQAELDRLTSQRDAELAEAEKLLDYYIDV